MRDKRWLTIALGAASALLAVAVYVNAIDNPFVYDDRRIVVENASIRTPLDARAVFFHDRFRPLVNLSYAADYALGGLAVRGYHVTGILLHALNVALLFLVTRRIFDASRGLTPSDPSGRVPRDPGRGRGARPAGSLARPGSAVAAAFAASSLFAVHPMMTQAVGYVSGRAEVLCTSFFLAAFLAALSWLARGRPAWVLACGLAWAMALASKEVAIAFPFALAAYGAFVLPGSSASARRRLAWAVAAMIAVMAVIATYRLATLVRVENAGRARFVWTNVLVGLDMFRQYAALMIVPAGQSIFHTTRVAVVTSPGIVLLNLATLAGLCLVAWRARRQEPAAAFGLAWFFLLLMPSTLLLAFDIGEPMAEQRVYLAAGGLAMAAGAGYARATAWLSRHMRRPDALAGAVLAACLAVLGHLTVERNRLWHDPVALWSEAVSREPEAWVPYRALGDALRERGDYPNAVDAYLEAARLAPEESAPYLPLATSLLMAGRLDEADRHFEHAERLSPGSVEAQTGRALVARMAGRRDDARDRLEAVARAHADAVLPRRLLAEMYEQEYGDRASALRACLEVRALAPGTPGVDDCVRRNQQPDEGAR